LASEQGLNYRFQKTEGGGGDLVPIREMEKESRATGMDLNRMLH